ncbi:hypothetical protein QF028_003063 [Neobacillus sp. B4I6]|uniref:hypothetical protein n=1 Tax=Neobacillus sp. B4I6 TaxID=3373925 RepID=UPI003D1FD579
MALTDKRTKSNIDGLTDKQRAFAIAFSGQGKGVIKESSSIVGIHVKTGEGYMKNQLVKDYIKELATVNADVMTGLGMQEKLTEMITNGTDEVLDFKSGKIVQVKMPNRDKIKAIELLAKMTGKLIPDNLHIHISSEEPKEIIDLKRRWDSINRKEVYSPSENDLQDIFGSGEDNEGQ